MKAPPGEIIAGYDGSELSCDAVRMACDVADPGAAVTVLHAYEVPRQVAYYPFFSDFLKACEEVAQEILDSARACAGERANVNFEVAAGRPAEVLARVAQERGAEVIVVGSRGLGPLQAVLGSVTHRLLHIAPCPVLVVAERRIESAAAG